MKVPLRKQFNLFLLLGTFLFSSAALFGQTGTVTGTVLDANGEPIIGANILIEGTSQGTVSDINGKYTLPNVPAGEVTITVSFVGYLSEKETITMTEGGTAEINFSIVEDLQQLSEVVVIGYGSVKKSDLTGAISSVDAEELTQLSTVSVEQAMQGRVAGVQVSSSTGAPGDGTKVRIRGIGTINNANPLYVVDGFPVSDIGYITPSDIENMEILKDASATAIYGNRGANGVVLITTKKGSKDGTKITFDMYYGTIQKPAKIPVLDAAGYAEAKYMAYDGQADTRGNDLLRLRGKGNAKDSAFQDAIDRNLAGTDWQDEVMRTGKIQNYSLSISGGSENYQYNVSGTLYREDGIINNSWHKRLLLRYASNFKVTERIDGEANISYRNFNQTNYDQSIYGAGVLPPALYADPISPAFTNDGDYGGVNWSQTTNPIAAADRNKYYIGQGDQFIINLGADVKIVKGLVFSSDYGIDINYQSPWRYTPVYNIGDKDENGQSQLNEDHQKNLRWNNSNYLNYNTTFGKNTLQLMAGQEWSYYSFDRTNLITFDVPDDPNLYYATASPFATAPIVNPDPSNLNRYQWETALMSFFGRVVYSFDNRYLLTATIRRDGTSKMTEDYRWGNFPSVSFGWNMKNEAFLSNVSFISSLKPRISWGITGNEGSVTDPYLAYASVSPGLYIIGEGDQQLQGQLQTVTPNPKLQWETVTSYNAAIDFGLFANKLVGTIDYFKKYTEGMIISVPPPLFQGGNAADANIGAMENEGIELSLSYRNFDGEFKYEIGGNITYMKHPLVTELAFEDQELIRGTVGKMRGATRTTAGEEMAHFYGYLTDGLLTAQDTANPMYEDFYLGAIKLVDANGDGVINVEDRRNMGSANPDYLLGLNLNFEYKGFDLKMFFDGVLGTEMINTMNVWLKVPAEGDQNLHEDVLNSWSTTNQNSDIPRLVQGNNVFQAYFNDYFVENASYFRVKNVQLGYTIPQSLLEKVGIERLRLYVSGENLLTFTEYSGYSPELGYLQYNTDLGGRDPLSQGLDDASYPVSRKFLFGINLTF